MKILTMAFDSEIATVSVAWEQVWGFRISEMRIGTGFSNVAQRTHVGFFNGVFPWRRHCHMRRISSNYKKSYVYCERNWGSCMTRYTLRSDNKNGEDYVHWMVFVLHRACTIANYDNCVNHQLGWCVRSYFVTIFSYYVLLTPFELDALCTIFRQSWVIHFASVYNMYGADSWLLQ